MAFAAAMFALAVMLIGFYTMVDVIGRNPSSGLVLLESALFWMALLVTLIVLFGGCLWLARLLDLNPVVALSVSFLLAGFSVLPVGYIIADTNACLSGPPVVLFPPHGAGCSR